LGAAKQVNRRRIDTLYNPTAVAVGIFGIYRVSVARRHAGAHWMSEIHEIVAGVDKDRAQKAPCFAEAILLSNS
jgi:hypothetical protein